MSDQPAAAAAAAVLRCGGCGLVLQDPITLLLRTVPDEAQNGRCLLCFPLPTPGDIAEMRRLQVEEYRLRVETARNHRGHFSAGGIPTTAAAAAAAPAAAAATTAGTQTAATAAASTQRQAMPVTPEQDVADGRQRNGDEVDVSPPVAARTIDTQAGQADQDQARPRPRALLKDSGDGPTNDGTGQGASAIAEEASASAGDTHSIGGNDNFAMAASTTPGPTVAAAAAAAASTASGASDRSLLSVVAMFEAQEREENNYGSDEDGGIEDIITECKRDSNRDGDGERGECANDNHQQEHLCYETADGKRKASPTEEGLRAQNSSAASALPVEDPCSDSEGSPRKKICSGGAHTDPLAESSTNCPISREVAREIEDCVKEGNEDSISLAKRDRCIEQLRLRIEGEEESTGMKAAYANTMISLEAPRMIVSALKRITASYATSCKKAKAKNSHARWAAECCHTLATIAYHGRAQSVVDSGAVTVAVLSALKMNSIRNLKLCLHGIEALQTLCSVSRATEEVLENEGLSIISATLSHLQKKESTKSSRDSKHAVRMIMKLLDNMSSSSQLLTPTARDQEDAARARMIGQHGFLKPILQMICDFPDEVELQLALCGALSSLSADEHNCNVIVELGGLRALVSLSDRHPLRSEMQKAVADCYAWLVADQTNNQLEACKDGVVEACIRLLQNRSHDSTVVHKSLNVLDSICESKECHDYLISANTVSAVTVVAAEAAYSNENDIQLLCQSFLCRLRRDAGASAET